MANALIAPGHFGEGARFVGARVQIAGSIYAGEIVGWYGSEKYTVKVDRGAREVAALAGPQTVAAYEYTELALV